MNENRYVFHPEYGYGYLISREVTRDTAIIEFVGDNGYREVDFSALSQNDIPAIDAGISIEWPIGIPARVSEQLLRMAEGTTMVIVIDTRLIDSSEWWDTIDSETAHNSDSERTSA